MEGCSNRRRVRQPIPSGIGDSICQVSIDPGRVERPVRVARANDGCDRCPLHGEVPQSTSCAVIPCCPGPEPAIARTFPALPRWMREASRLKPLVQASDQHGTPRRAVALRAAFQRKTFSFSLRSAVAHTLRARPLEKRPIAHKPGVPRTIQNWCVASHSASFAG